MSYGESFIGQNLGGSILTPGIEKSAKHSLRGLRPVAGARIMLHASPAE